MRMIPKIVHLTYKSKETIPDKWKQTIPAWEKYGWKVMFHSDEDNHQLVRTEYPQLYSTYKSYTIPIQRVDAVRLCYLHKYGGVYADLDLLPQEDVYSYFAEGSLVLMRSPNTPITLTNMLMASVPEHPFWLEYLEGLNQPYMPWYAHWFRHFKVMYSTGPMLLTRVAYRSKHALTILPLSFLPCSICDLQCTPVPILMLEGQSWNGPDSYILNIIICHWKKLLLLFVGLVIAYSIWNKQKQSNLNQTV